VPINYGSNLTLIGALGITGLDALMTVDGATDGEIFRVYVGEVLCPTLREGDIVVMAHVRTHFIGDE
jgi:hypothetical protein